MQSKGVGESRDLIEVGMLYLLSISVILVGAALLSGLIVFAPRRHHQARRPPYDDECETGAPGPLSPVPPESASPPEPEGSGPRPSAGWDGEEIHSTKVEGGGTEARGGAPGASSSEGKPIPGTITSIPIVRLERRPAGLGERELIHFCGRGRFSTIDDARELREIAAEHKTFQPDVEGELVLTSKQIVVTDGKTTKKILYGAIERYHLHGDSMVIRKKRAKTKKTVLKVFGDFEDFRYIVGALIPL